MKLPLVRERVRPVALRAHASFLISGKQIAEDNGKNPEPLRRQDHDWIVFSRSWPQAAEMSRPRDSRTGAVR